MRIIVENRTNTRLPSLSLPSIGRAAEKLLHLARGSEVTVTFVPSRNMRALNHRFRGINRTTDVLSFPLHTGRPFPRDPDGVMRLGDIIVSLPTARRQAQRRQVALREELRELIVHGLLHLVGYDHNRQKAMARMRRATATLLGSGFRPSR